VAKKDAGTYIFGNHFQLFSQDNVHALADVLRFLLTSQTLQAHTERNVCVVVVAIRLERLFGELGGVLILAVREKSSAKDVPGAIAITLAFDGPAGHEF
jgi:hypothetical protein